MNLPRKAWTRNALGVSAARTRVVVLGMALCAGSAMSGDNSAIRFVDASESAGLVYTSVHGPAPKYPTLLGGGTVGDFNNDGFADVWALGNGGVADGLFINNGDGTFTEQASAWGVDEPHYSFGASTADFNNDGLLDVYITSYGSVAGGGVRNGQLKLYRNNGPDESGQWSFTDVAVEAGVNAIESIATDGTGSAWGDIDLDGDLDLFVAGYNPNRRTKRMFRNDGPDEDGVWRFADITEQAELQMTTGRWIPFVPALIDLTGDRYPDLLTISDYKTSRFSVNDQDGTFTDRLELAPEISLLNGMGLDFGDVNGDGRIDFYATSIAWDQINGPGNQLMVQQEDGSFVNTAFEAQCFAGYWGWGAVMADLDHDADLDIVETNGFQLGVNTTPAQPAVVFENNGDGSLFTEVAEQSGLIHWIDGRGMSKFDSDNDGDLDIVIFASGDKLAYFRNDLITQGTPAGANQHWIRIALDTRANDALAPQGIGSMIRVRTDEREIVLPVHSNSNHCSSSPIEVHSGLGSSSVIDALRVEWADGSFSTLSGIDANQILTIEARAFAADLDSSGAVDFGDVSAFVKGYFAADLNTDFTGDWVIDIFDVLAFIRWYNADVE